MPIHSLTEVREGQLTWPDHQPRAAQRQRASFKAEPDRAQREVEIELERLGAREHVISRNRQRIFAGDPAVAVWWTDKKGELRVLACDKWDRMGDNLRAIAKTVEAWRGLERWGAYSLQQAAEGAKLRQLPPPEGSDWRKLFGLVAYRLPPADLLTLAERRYRDHSREAQGNETTQRILNIAIEAARKELAP